MRDLTDDGFRVSFAYAAPAVVRSRGAASTSVTAVWDGDEPFVLSGFPLQSPLWLSVEPSAGSAHLRTLHPLPLPRSAPVDLGLVRADTLDLIFLLQTVPAERIARRGHVALLFTQGEGLNAGVAGVSVGLSEAGLLAYAVGGTWTDVEDRTDPSGRVVLGNISAAPFPGLTRRITLSGARQGFIDVVVVDDAVSLVEARLPAQP